MLAFPLRGALALAAVAALALPARAELVIDDFTVGGFFRRMVGRESYTHEEGGLDRAHSAWGHRALMVNINSNPNNTYLDVTVGGGRQRFESPLPVMWRSTLLLADPPAVVDFTGQTRINVDYNSFPPNAFADTWDILVRDVHGVDASNGNWLLRPEGIYFEIADFSRPVDWSRIEVFRFSQHWNSLPNPLSYEVTKIYAVPEPGTLSALAGLGLLALRRRRAGPAGLGARGGPLQWRLLCLPSH